MSVSGLLLLGGLAQCNTYTPDLLLEPIQASEPEPTPDDDVEPSMPAGDDVPVEPEPSPTATPEPLPPEPQPAVEPATSPEPSGSMGPGPGPTDPPSPEPAPPGGGAGGTAGGGGGAGAVPSGGTSGTGGVPANPDPDPEPTAGAAGAVVAPTVDPKLIENFEDGNATLLANQGRRGFWFTDGGEEGTISAFEVEPLDPANEQLPNSTRAMHVTATDFATDSWATAGVTLNNGAVYDGAAGFEGIEFWARHGGTGSAWFSFRVPTESTSEDDDHFGVLFELTDTWRLYRVPFDETLLQQQGFGDVQVFDSAELMELQFSLAPGATGFDLWVDDIAFY